MHRLKNAQCRARAAVDGLRYAQLALLTGTPVQNSPAELFSLLNLLAPRTFADADAFEAKYVTGTVQAEPPPPAPLAKAAAKGKGKGAEKDAPDAALAVAETPQAALQRAIAPYLLRRLKSAVLGDEMPPKRETVVPIELTMRQKATYRALLERNVAALTSTSGGSRAGEPSLSNVFGQLRKLCNHPSLLEKADAKLPPLGDKSAVAAALDALVGASGKMQLLHKLVTRLREEGRKVLIFSQVRVPPDCPLSAL